MKKDSSNRLAFKMMVAMLLGLACGVGLIALRETLNANGGQETWQFINSIFFADISVAGN